MLDTQSECIDQMEKLPKVIPTYFLSYFKAERSASIYILLLLFLYTHQFISFLLKQGTVKLFITVTSFNLIKKKPYTLHKIKICYLNISVTTLSQINKSKIDATFTKSDEV